MWCVRLALAALDDAPQTYKGTIRHLVVSGEIGLKGDTVIKAHWKVFQ